MLKRMNTNGLLLILLIMVFGLVACTVVDPKLMDNTGGGEIERVLREGIAANKMMNASASRKLPDPIKKALVPAINTRFAVPFGAINTAQPNDQQRFNIVANNVPAKDFFAGLVRNTKYNMTVSPLVSGMISLELKRVTISDVMDTVREVYGFEYQLTPSGYQVSPRQLKTQIFNVNYLNMDRNGKSNTTFSSGELSKSTSYTSPVGVGTNQKEVSPSGSIETISKASFWNELKQNLEMVVGTQDGRSVVINPQSGAVIVRAYTDELRKVDEYLESIQSNMQRQVLIEAQVLEVQLSAAYQTGINWRLFDIWQGPAFNDGGYPTPGNTVAGFPNVGTAPGIANQDNFSSIFTLSASRKSSFHSFIQLLSTQGKVNVLSSPRVSTTNNQKAVIKVGQNRFFVTDVSSNTVASTATSTSQNITLTPFFSGIALDVTPQINRDGNITLHIHPVVSTVTLDRQQFTVNGQPQDLPLAQSSVRESDSIVRAKSGQIVVIGGLMQSSSSDYGARTPGTERLGIFSGLFKSVNKSASKLELVILLRPVLVGAKYNWNGVLQEEAARVKDMQRSDFQYKLVDDKAAIGSR